MLVGTLPGWFQFRAHEHFQTRLGQAPVGLRVPQLLLQDTIWEKEGNAGLQVSFIRVIILSPGCSTQSLSLASPLSKLGQLLQLLSNSSA